MIMETKFYRVISDYKGHHYFMVKSPENPVVKVTFGVQPKKGRPFCPGITLINYNTFISSYGWNMTARFKEAKSTISEITKEEFEKAKKTLSKTLEL